MLARLVHLPGFKVDNRAAILRALELFAGTKLDFGDCLVVAAMDQADSKAAGIVKNHTTPTTVGIDRAV